MVLLLPARSSRTDAFSPRSASSAGRGPVTGFADGNPARGEPQRHRQRVRQIRRLEPGEALGRVEEEQTAYAVGRVQCVVQGDPAAVGMTTEVGGVDAVAGSRLERAGWVRRIRSEGDRRKVAEG